MFNLPDPPEEAVKVFKDMVISRLIENGQIISKDNLRSYLKVNYDDIYDFISKISFNAALSLEIIKEDIDNVSLPNLLNIEQIREDGIEKTELLLEAPTSYLVFFASWLWYTEPLEFMKRYLVIKLINRSFDGTIH